MHRFRASVWEREQQEEGEAGRKRVGHELQEAEVKFNFRGCVGGWPAGELVRRRFRASVGEGEEQEEGREQGASE